MCDIFGKSVVVILYYGIVDFDDVDDFYVKLCFLEKVWNDCEREIIN